MAVEIFGHNVEQFRIDIKEAKGKTIQHVSDSKGGDSLLIGFDSGEFAFLIADHCESVDETNLEDERFHDWHAHLFDSKDLRAVFGDDLTVAYMKKQSEALAERTARLEEEERKEYEKLKAKFEKAEQ